MDDKLKNALYERYTRSCRPQYFASWAKLKASELNILRHRHLGGNQEVIWDIAKDNGKAADHNFNFNPRPPWGGRLQKYTNMQCYACT